MVNSEQILLTLAVIVIAKEVYNVIKELRKRYILWKSAREIEKIINEGARRINEGEI